MSNAWKGGSTHIEVPEPEPVFRTWEVRALDEAGTQMWTGTAHATNAGMSRFALQLSRDTGAVTVVWW